MTIKIRLAAVFASLLLPIAAFAAAPGNVTGIHAQMQGGKVFVSWNPVTDQHIASYRIYYSHQSILANNGLYDDYEIVDGSVNSDTLQNMPPVQTLYIAMVAVNDQGESSPSFTEEASIALNGMAQATASSSAGTTQPPLLSAIATQQSLGTSSQAPATTNNSNVLQLLTAQAVSATGVQLTFSGPVTVDQNTAANAFSIKTASGASLHLVRLTIKGNIVLIDTEPQTRTVVYVLTVGSGVSGKDANGNVIPFDSTQAPLLFTGSPAGLPPMQQQPQPATQTTGGDVSNLHLTAQAGQDGTYTVSASWLAPATGSIADYQVAQSTNGGATYGTPSTVDRGAGGISIPHVPAGTFAIQVKVVYSDGTVSSGAMQTINLPSTGTASSQPSNNQQANLTQQPTTTKLPKSGPAETVMALMLLGALVGYRFMKKASSQVGL